MKLVSTAIIAGLVFISSTVTAFATSSNVQVRESTTSLVDDRVSDPFVANPFGIVCEEEHAEAMK